MADSLIKVSEPAIADKNVATQSLVGAGGATVEREEVILTGTALAERVLPTNALPGAAAYALPVREVARGQGNMAGSMPVVLASDQTVVPVSDGGGSVTVDAPVATPVFVRLSDGAAAQIGQKAKAASIPVTIASDQDVVATSALQTTGNTSLSSIDGKITTTTSAPGVAVAGVITRPVETARVLAGNLNALNAEISIDLDGMHGAGFIVGATTLIGVLVAELSADGGTTWIATSILNHATIAWSTSGIANPVANTEYTILISGPARKAKVRVSSFVSGTAAGTIGATKTISPLALCPTLAIAGTTTPFFVTAVSGVDGTGVCRSFLIKTAAPGAADNGLVVREAQRGQGTMAASIPMVIASDQTAIPVTTVVPGTAATNLGKAEDAAHTTGDVGVMALGVRKDVPNLPTAADTSGNSDYAALATDDHGVPWVRKRQLVSYCASYRLADATAGQLDLTFTFAANTNKQVATIYHANTAAKTVKIRKISVFCTTMTAAIVGFEVRALSLTTAPATGNPAITPGKYDPADGAAEVTCLALPTTAGSLVAADSPVSAHVSINAGATTASVSPASFGTEEIVLYEYKDGMEMKPLTIRAGNAEGYCVNARSTAATAQRFTVVILFTEE